MMNEEKKQILNSIDRLGKSIENGLYDDVIKPEYRKVFKLGQLSAILEIKELIKYNEY